MDNPLPQAPKEWQGPEARRLLADLQLHPGWRLVLAWWVVGANLGKVLERQIQAVGRRWRSKRG